MFKNSPHKVPQNIAGLWGPSPVLGRSPDWTPSPTCQGARGSGVWSQLSFSDSRKANFVLGEMVFNDAAVSLKNSLGAFILRSPSPCYSGQELELLELLCGASPRPRPHSQKWVLGKQEEGGRVAPPSPGSVCLSGGEPPPVPSSVNLRSRAHRSSIPADTSEFWGKKGSTVGAQRHLPEQLAQQTASLLKAGVGCVKLPVHSCPGPAPGAAVLGRPCSLSAYELGWGGTALRCFRVLTGFMLIGSDVKLNSPSSLIGQALTEILQHPERARDALRVLLHLVRGAGPSGSGCDARAAVRLGVPRQRGQGVSRWRGLCPRCLWVKSLGPSGEHGGSSPMAHHPCPDPAGAAEWDSEVGPDHSHFQSCGFRQITLLSEPQLRVEADKNVPFQGYLEG